MRSLAWGIFSGAMGWVGASYVYGQLPPGFKKRRPVLAAAIVGGITGLVLLSVLNLLTTKVLR